MATLTRSITNASSTTALVLGIPGFDPTSQITIPASGTVDLLSVMTPDSLHAFQGQIAQIVAAGEATVAATIDSASLYPAALMNYVVSSDTQFTFSAATYSATHTAGATAIVQVKNAAGAVDPFNQTSTVKVVAISTSTGTPTLNGTSTALTATGTLATATFTVADSTGWTVGDTVTQGVASTTVASKTATTIVLTSATGFSTGTITNGSAIYALATMTAGVASVVVKSASSGTVNLVLAQPTPTTLTHSSTAAVTLS